VVAGTLLAVVAGALTTATGAAAGTGAPTVAPTPSAPQAARTGLRADYFIITDTNTFALEDKNLTVSVLDPDIDVNDMIPVYKATTGRSENVGVRWTGTVTAPATGDYTFSAIGDNGFRLWVGGTADTDKLIDFWVNQWDVEQTAIRPVHLVAGQPTPIRFEQFQATGGANVHLRWQSTNAGVPKQAVPGSAFSPPADFVPFQVAATIPADGKSVRLSFAGQVGGLTGLADHLRIVIDGADYPVTGIAAGSSASQLIVSLGATVLKGSYARVAYDGKGELTVDGTKAPPFNSLIENTSTYTLTTPWADDVNTAAPLPEYPRPQLTRKEWKNLNGKWDFAALAAANSPLPKSWRSSEKVVVPYPIESKLSGINRHEDHFAYHRTFDVPHSWKVGTDSQHGKQNRLLLNFQAVDFDATVLVNGITVARHKGGYDAFSVDVTNALRRGTNELVVKVTDTTGYTPKGKQSSNPSGIFYTAASGIWQTVWMEPVAPVHIGSVKTTPVLSDRGDSVRVTVSAAGASPRATVRVTAYDKKGRQVTMITGQPNTRLTLPISGAHRWTPDDPYLYDLKVTLDDRHQKDKVGSYVGVRSIGIQKIDGVNRIVLNGKRTFLLSTLDQGYWPDGVYTAPTDQALAWDIQETKDLGFNTIRKHIKVESQRWYYHADQIGMMVWQDMPAAFTGRNPESTSKPVTDEWESELHRMIEQHASSPSIIGWIPFNEGWSEWNLADTARVANGIKAQDPSRLVDTHSGVNCCQSLGDSGTGDIIDYHAYTGPASPDPDATRAAIDGEHGGFSLSVLGHTWPGGSVNPYGEVRSSKELTDAYVANTAMLVGLAREKLSGSVYTQLTDVEGEVNGFWTYDRRVSKMDRPRVRAANLAVIAAGTGAKVPGTPGPNGIAGWKFDVATGDQTPGSGKYPVPATLFGGAGLVAGVQGKALGLDGVDDQATATVSRLDTTGNYSVAAWVRLDTVPSNFVTAVAADGLNGTSPFFLQYVGADRGWAMSFPDGPRAVAPFPAVAGQWYHLVGVRDADNGTLSLYVDGSLAATERTWATTATTGLVTVGRAQFRGNAVDFMHGAVDDVRLYDRALNASEVSGLATGTQ